jgi:Fe2+ transport system protein FeoA
MPAQEETAVKGSNLADIPLGGAAEVIKISPICRGVERRRFLDLGILPGTIIQPEMRSPGGNTTAYRIRGALIALRQQQAAQIKVKPVEDTQ